jgi:hypothetical protein
MAIRVERRDQNDDDVVEDAEGVWVASRREPVEQVVRGLRRADFRCVDAAANGDDGLVRRRDRPGFVGRKGARICQPLVGRADSIEISYVLGRADDGGGRSMALGGGAEVDHLHAVRLRCHRLEVLLDTISCRQPAGRAHAKAEVRFGRGYLGAQLARRRKRKRDRRQEDDESKAPERAGHDAGTTITHDGPAKAGHYESRAIVAPRCAAGSSQKSSTRG